MKTHQWMLRCLMHKIFQLYIGIYNHIEYDIKMANPIEEILNEERLIKAVKSGDYEKIKQLLDSGISPNVVYKNVHPLFMAFNCNDDRIVDLFISHPLIDLMIVDNKGRNLLDYAIINGDDGLTDKLIKSGNYRYYDGVDHSSLKYAIKYDNEYAITLLLDDNEPVTEQDLIESIESVDDSKLIKQLFRARTTPISDSIIFQLLFDVVQGLRYTLFKYIVKHYRNQVIEIINNVDEYENTILRCIVGSNFEYELDIIEQLLKLGANSNRADSNGDTPLHIAAKYGLIDKIKLLLEYGADKTLVNKEGQTAEEIAYDDDIAQIIRDYQSLFNLKEPDM